MTQLSTLKPIVKNLSSNGKKLVIGKLGDADFKISFNGLEGELSNNAVRALYDGLASVMNVNAKDANGKIEIFLEISTNIPAEVTKNEDQAYKLSITSKKITLTGYGEAGLYYAVNTLLQLVKVEDNVVYVPQLTAVDFPDLKTRGHFIETRFGTNLMKLDDWKAVVDNMASMKLNQLVVSLYGCWSVQYDGEVSEYVFISVPKYPLIKKDVVKKYFSPKKGGWVNEVVEVPMAKEDFFGELVAYGKSKGVEVLPLWNSLGHNTLIPTKYPETAPLVGGERSKCGFCVSSPKTYELLFDIYDTIINKYLAPNGIRSFHVGLDEVCLSTAVDPDDVFKQYSPWCECEECSKLSNMEKLINHAIKLISYLKSRGMKNIYMYNDLFSKTFQEPEIVKKAFEKAGILDVTVVDWWAYSDIAEKLSTKTTYPHLGIRSTVKPWNSYYHWNVMKDSVWNIYHHSVMANKEGCEGLQSYASWDLTCDINHLAMADYSWNFADSGSVEDYRNRYALRNFPNNYDVAKRAFELFAKVTSQGNALPTPEDPSFGYGSLVKENFAYYAYSYVRAGQPYPRNFPGEPVGRILQHRELREAALKTVSALANEAYELFETLKADVTGNTHMARRYAAEMRNYRDIVDDFLALLKIYDLANDPEAKGAQKKIAKIAAERKINRIELIAEMEDFKEEYLHASHLRNQSIFMQTFADIEAYANKTPAKDFKLDVLDMREIGSKTFYNLR